jgi:hypothetical protein
MPSDVYDIYDTQIDKLTRHKILLGWKCCTYEGGLLADGTMMLTKLNALGMALNLMSGQAK